MRSAALLALVLFAIGFVPLLGGPRYEAALVAGLLAPSFAAISAALACRRLFLLALSAARADELPRGIQGGTLLLASARVAALHVLAVLSVATLHGLLSGFCEPAQGYGLLLLGPSVGILLAALTGSVLGAFITCALPTPKGAFLCGFLALLFPLGSALIGVYRFYDTPAVFAYDPFVGYFSGPLYDTVEYDLTRLLTYRVGTLCTLLGVGTALFLCDFQMRKAGVRALLSRKPGAGAGLPFWGLGSSFVLLAGSLTFSAYATDLHHASTAQSIKAELGRTTTFKECQVHFSIGVEAEAAKLMAKECHGHLVQLSDYFQIAAPKHVDVFVFASPGEKRLLMGAATTYVAKPWRREIYVQPGGFPHPVLGHELAHVMTGEFGQGPMKLAGSLGGMVPDPGRIEGFAEAAAPHEHADGTLHEWASAMRELKLLPRLSRLFQLGFFGESAARSYGAAGSFVDFLRVRSGPEALRRWYGGASLEEVASADLPQLEREWHDFLGKIKVSARVMEIAEPRFSRPGVFERRCPHAVDRAVAEGARLCSVQSERARDAFDLAIQLDERKFDLRLQMPRCSWYGGDVAGARQELTGLVAEEDVYSPGARQGGLEFLGDLEWNSGREREAKMAYERAQILTFRRDEQRQLEVKLWGLGQDQQVKQALRGLLAPAVREERVPAIELATWYATGSHKDLAGYLLLRAALRALRLKEAEEYGQALQVEKLPLASLKREALRDQLLLTCLRVMGGGAEGPLREAEKSYLALGLEGAEALEVERLVPRCLASVPSGGRGVKESSAE